MMVAISVVVLALIALVCLIIFARGQASAISQTSQLPGRTRAVDLQAFRNLVDPAEQEYLRQHLPAAQYRKIQRERLRAAIDYVDAVSENAAVLLRLGEAARSSEDPALAQAGMELITTALRVRVQVLAARAKLYAGMVAPRLVLAGHQVSESYENLTGLVARLGRLQNHAQGFKLSTVL